MNPEPLSTIRLSQSGDSLEATLDLPLPTPLEVGRGTAFLICGSCFHPRERLRGLWIRIGDHRTKALAFGMPRPDRAAASTSANAHRSGFWAVVAVPPHAAEDEVEVVAEAELGRGAAATASLGAIELVSDPKNGPADAAGPARRGDRVAICMATYEPPRDLLERQLDSIRAQTHATWTCVISDDASSPEARAAIRAAIGNDDRFRLIEHERRLGLYGNFERALRAAPADAAFIALADQDDRWDPEKLATLLAAIGDAPLAYGDARVVDRDGTLRSPTYWSRRPNNYTDLASLALANTVSGSAALYRRELVELALPFPPAHCHFFHDHWLPLCALATGRIAYVDRPLYDYVQHTEAALGHERAQAWTARRRRLATRLRHFRADPQYFHDHWRDTYFTEYLRVAVMAQTLLLRADDRLGPAARRTLRRLTVLDRSPAALAWLAARRLRRIVGADETLAAEARLLRAFAWRHGLTLGPEGARFLPRDGRWAQLPSQSDAP